MSKVERYTHLRNVSDPPKGGVTIRIVGDTDVVGHVDVQYVRCSRKDNFVKSIGRELSKKAVTKIVPLRYLPHEIRRISEKTGFPSPFDDSYDWVLKYFLPKE